MESYEKVGALMVVPFSTEAIWTPEISARLKRVGRIGPISKQIAPGYGACYRCQTVWCFVESHSTMFTETEGCFALCEECWTELETPEARLPYYRMVWDLWCINPLPDDEYCLLRDIWNQIEAAVLAGK